MTLLPGILSAQQGETGTPIIRKFSFSDGANISNLSDNGLWATAKGKNAGDETRDDHPYLLDVTAGSYKYLLTSEETAKGTTGGAYDVTNDGTVVVGSYNLYPAIYRNESWTKLTNQYGSAEHITPDGKYIIGNFRNGYNESPLMWELKDGEYTSIPVNTMNLPTKNAANETAKQNRFVGISADGNMILGCLDFSYPGKGGCCYYTYNRQTDQYKMIGLNKLQIPDFVDMAVFSNDGRWVTGTVYYAKEGVDYNYPYTYNTQTEVFTILDESDADDTGSFAINNNGTTFAASPYNNPGRILQYKVGDFWYTLQLILYERYGINFFTTTGFGYTGTAMAISDDGKTLAAIAMSQMNSYIITLPETFEEAASHVNLLAAYSITPATGMTLSRVKTFTILFDKEAVVDNSKVNSVNVKDSKGNIIAKAYGIKKDASTAKKFYIYFQTETLNDGERYTLTIPEGTFTLPGTDMKNKEITVTYIGRDNIPVIMKNVSPANNSFVSEFSHTSPVTLQFDVPLTLTSGVLGKLYQEDETEPLCDLALEISSNYLAVYPTIKRYFYKDVKYKIVIPAGAVADILGECANEEIILNYNGIYERPLDDNNLLFFEDFNDPNTSANNLITYDGDGNTPNSEMSGYGFQTNTGWHLFIRESEESSNYCAASTSMYNPAGKSNDWMSTPQLYLPNKYYNFTFKSQSYKKDKSDRLKVYVWENDEVISVFNDDIIKRFKEEGTLIYDELETPGNNEGYFEDEWKESGKISLKQFSGKNIYIGFLNENEDQSMIFVDDIAVTYEGPFSLGSTTEETVSGATEIQISGFVRNTSDNVYTSLRAYYFNDDKSVKEEITISDLNMKKDDVQKFIFNTPLPLATGKITNYTIGVEIGDAKQEIKANTRNLAFTPTKRIVIEEGTGTWCGNCPFGFIALEHLENLYHDQVIPIGVHSQDAFEFAEYISHLDYKAYPQGIINRIDTIYVPMYSADDISFTSPTGNKTFTDIVLREMEKYADADVHITNAIYDPSINQLSVTTSINYALDIESNNCNVFYVILENGLPGTQDNYLSGVAYEGYPILGKWIAGQEYGTSKVNYIYDDVARAIIGTSFNGLSGYIPTSVTANSPIQFNIYNSIPPKVTDMNNASVVCMLINMTTGRVINAAKANFTQGVVSINELSTAENNININAKGQNVTVQFENDGKATVILYDINGKIINQASSVVNAGESMSIGSNGHTGIVITRVVSNNQVKVQKVFIK